MMNIMTQHLGRSNLKRQNKDIIFICILNFANFCILLYYYNLRIVIYIERMKKENMMISLTLTHTHTMHAGVLARAHTHAHMHNVTIKQNFHYTKEMSGY